MPKDIIDTQLILYRWFPWQGGSTKPIRKEIEKAYSEAEILGEILREGIYWAFMGRPFEVLPFLRGKLLSKAAKLNGSRGNVQLEIERLLNELEQLYREISISNKISEEQIKEILGYKERFSKMLSFGDQ